MANRVPDILTALAASANPRIGAALLVFVGVGSLFLLDAALGLVLFAALAITLVYFNIAYALWFLPLVVLLRNSDLSGSGASEGNILLLWVAAGIALFALRHGRFKITLLSFLAFLAGMAIILSTVYHLALGEPDVNRIVRYSILALSAVIFIAAIGTVDDGALSKILSPVPVLVVLLVLIFINLAYSWSTHGWYWGGRLSVRLSPTDTINTALPMAILWLLAFWRLRLVRGVAWYFSLGVLLAGVVAIFLTGARAVMLALLAGILVPYVVNLLFSISSHLAIQVRLIKAFGIVLSGMIVVGFLVYQGFLFDHAAGFRVLQDPTGSAMARLDIWQAWMGELHSVSMITGVGVGAERESVGTHPHSVYFGVWVYSGVFAFLFLCLLLAVVGVEAWRQQNFGAIGILAATTIVFVTAVQPDRPDLWFALMLMVSLLHVGRRQEGP